MAITFHTIKRKPYGSCQLPITVTTHDHLIQKFIYHHVLTISHHSKPCKNKLDILYFVVASLTWPLWASSKNHSYLRIKTTTIFWQVCCFNLQQGSGIATLDSTKVGETDTLWRPRLDRTLIMHANVYDQDQGLTGRYHNTTLKHK